MVEGVIVVDMTDTGGNDHGRKKEEKGEVETKPEVGAVYEPCGRRHMALNIDQVLNPPGCPPYNSLPGPPIVPASSSAAPSESLTPTEAEVEARIKLLKILVLTASNYPALRFHHLPIAKITHSMF